MRNYKMFKETTKYFKRMIKDRYFVQFVGDTVYISNGHFIVVMPVCFYNEEILTSVPGMPTYTGTDGKFVGNAGKVEEGSFDVEKCYKDSLEYTTIETTPSSMLCDIGGKLARCFVWEKDGKSAGAMISEDYFKISSDFGGNWRCSSSNAPLIKGNEDIAFLVLPVCTRGTFLESYLNVLNRPAETRYIA